MNIVTPSYLADLERCRRLNESIMAFAPREVRHSIVVDACDKKAFTHLADSRTEILCKQEVLPRQLWRARRSNRWLTSSLRIHVGWFVQQVVKIRMTELVDGPFCIFADSDAVFVRPFELATLTGTEEKPRLYRIPDRITGEAQEQHRWIRAAGQMLGITTEFPHPAYISNVVSWHRQSGLSMLSRIEEVSGRSWFSTITRVPGKTFSECFLYGVFADSGLCKVPFAHDARSLCHSFWSRTPLQIHDVDAFIGALGTENVAIAIQSVSGTPDVVVSQLLQRVTNGVLR